MRLQSSSLKTEIRRKLKSVNEKKLAEELGIGEYTLHDIIEELEKPGRDPREKLDGPILRSDVMDIAESLQARLLVLLALIHIHLQ